ncbi:N-acetyltransferase [Bisbaumannia pacifica]|uniref:N-acetyltransferase n=1 Tax=Bisbaumannia pacifica TaxID=77098 RepID=A0A510XBU1_9GAMM|nr:GNAT family N-acetyltransferase [Halomonas pacifica]GEK48904.1 N-acetyltransferase [Halomonas pacifica]
MNDLIVRIADDHDIDNIAGLFDLYRQFYGQESDCVLAYEFIKNRIEREEFVVFLAMEKGVSIGFCQLYPSFCSVDAMPIYILYDLYVKPEYRKHGVARKLMLAAEEHAIKSGKKRLELSTAKNNHSAQKLYESLGWVKDEVFLCYSRDVKG